MAKAWDVLGEISLLVRWIQALNDDLLTIAFGWVLG